MVICQMTYRPMNRDLADGAIETERSWIRNLDFKAKKASAFCDIPPFWQIASKQITINSTDCLNSGWFPWQHKLLNRFSTDFPSNVPRIFRQTLWYLVMFREISSLNLLSFISGLESQISSLKAWNPMKSPYPVKKNLFTSSSQVSVVTTIGVTGGLKTRKGIMKQSLVTFLCSARPSEIMPFFDWPQIFQRFYLYKHSGVSLVQRAFLQVLNITSLHRTFHQNRLVSTPSTKLRKGRRWHQTHPKRHSCGSTDWGQEWQNPTSESHVSSSTGRYHGCVGI